MSEFLAPTVNYIKKQNWKWCSEVMVDIIHIKKNCRERPQKLVDMSPADTNEK